MMATRNKKQAHMIGMKMIITMMIITTVVNKKRAT